MEPFVLEWPTRIVFGIGEISKIGEETRRIGRRALLVTGRSAMRRLGILDRVGASLKKGGVEFVHYDRVEPNPRVPTVNEGGRLAREEKCDCIVAVGGGSVMDAAKGMATVAMNGGSVWEYMRTGRPSKPFDAALPTLMVPTIAATCSEADAYGVITNWETHEKAVLSADCLLPKTAIVDPELTVSVSRETTGDGGIDMLCHLLETYFTGNDGSPVSDRISEGLILSVMDHLKGAMDDGKDLEAREALSWVSTLALSGIPSAGRDGPFPLHAIEHSLSGHYDIPHGRGLATLLPHLMAYTMVESPRRYAKLGIRVFGQKPQGHSYRESAEVCLDSMVQWLKDIGMYTRLSDVGIDDSKFEVMAEDALRLYGDGKNHLDNPRKLDREGILSIYQAAI